MGTIPIFITSNNNNIFTQAIMDLGSMVCKKANPYAPSARLVKL